VGAWGTIVPWLPPSTTDEVGAGPGSPGFAPGRTRFSLPLHPTDLFHPCSLSPRPI